MRDRLFLAFAVASLGAVAIGALAFGELPAEKERAGRELKKTAAAPAFAYRVFKLPDTDPQLSVKLAGYAEEGWEFVGPSTSAPALFRRPMRNADDLDKTLLALLQHTWSLDKLSQYGVAVWPNPGTRDCPTAPKQESTAPPLILKFDGAAFQIRSTTDAPVAEQQGAIQYLAGTADQLDLDLLIDGNDPANPWLTVRCRARFKKNESEKKGPETYQLIIASGGLGADRPTQVVGKSIPASSTYVSAPINPSQRR
jgi:hypothetical protein